jgi:ADP-heptose:LPS heptosyltransferase/glycosyltransferase involved in cell wall biosynthesis
MTSTGLPPCASDRFPTVSIVTPSFNQGKYIGDTIESVLSQEGDFFLEYIVMDGDSKDETLDILKKYERLLQEKQYPIRCRGIAYRWQSGPDKGQGDAVSRGFAAAKGDILGWLNSDDIYNPGALRKAVEVFGQDKKLGYLYGDVCFMNESGGEKTYCKYPSVYSWKKFIWGRQRGLVQPSVFVRKEVFETVGPVDTRWYFALDQDWFVRIDQKFRGRYVPFPFATERKQPQAKTYDRLVLAYLVEAILLLAKYGGKKTLLRNFSCSMADLAIKKELEPHKAFEVLKEGVLKRGDLFDGTRLTPEFLSHLYGYGLLRLSIEICRRDPGRAVAYLIRALKAYPAAMMRLETPLILLKLISTPSFYAKAVRRLGAAARNFFLETLSCIPALLSLPWRIVRKKAFRSSSVPIREILIVYMAEGLGDVIMLSGVLPAVRYRFPEARIRLLIFERYCEFFRGNPCLDDIIGYPDYRFEKSGVPAFLSFAGKLRGICRPDILLDLLPDKRFASGFFSCLIPSRFSAGFGYLWKKACYDSTAKIDWGTHFYELIYHVLKFAGVETKPPRFWIPPLESEADVTAGMSGLGRTVVVAPGGKNNLVEKGNESRWDFGGYHELVKMLTERQFRVVLVGAEYDRDEIWDRFPADCVTNLIGKTSIRQLFHLVLKKADLVVCNNSGLLHVAAALNVPTVSFAGPLENVVRFGPYPNDGRHKVLQPKMSETISKEEFLTAILEGLSRYAPQEK